MSFLTLTYKPNFKKAPIVSLNGEPVLLFNQQQHTLLDVLEIKKLISFLNAEMVFAVRVKLASIKVQ